jgi:4-amino-4-deoxy-L-arabinose transferase-like glycosyltransferase
VKKISKAAFLSLSTFALYFLTRSPALDEHDSVQLAMGVLHFDIWHDQPHAPGYPLFIFLAWCAKAFLGTGPDLSFHFLSAVGGALFVATWFVIISRQFDERLGWWVALCLAITPAVWMTATKALTDSLAAAFVTAQILAAIVWSEHLPPFDGSNREHLQWTSNARLIAMALLGAAATGVRPQLILVVLAVAITSLCRARSGWEQWSVALVSLVIGCLLWLAPLSYMQWRLQPDTPLWSVFPRLAYHQWAWRFDKPGVYLGAGDWSAHYLAARSIFHFLGWFALGFGFIKSPVMLLAGGALALASLTSYFAAAWRPADHSFWRFHAPWVITHVLVIFISLSPAQRYYLLVFPLILTAMLSGLLRLASGWNRAAILIPALLLYIGIPLAIDNHCNEPPALRLVRFVSQLYPATRRSDVVLLFNEVRRHAQWYAPDFVTVHDLTTGELEELSANAAAIYTDDPKAALPPGWHRIALASFMRSGAIYWKHHSVELYLIDRGSH